MSDAEVGGSGSSVLRLARKEAVRLGHPYVGVEHLFLGLLQTNDAEVVARLNEIGASPEIARAELEKTLPQGHPAAVQGRSDLPYTTRTKRVLSMLLPAGDPKVPGDLDGIAILNAIRQEGSNVVAQVLRQLEEGASES
jgi:ATP-dependent Clp protease ATP-binding subunit ClpC